MITPEILEMLFEEYGDIVGMTLDEWKASIGYNENMSDQEIYSLLPPGLQAMLGEFVLNASWLHSGM